MISIFFISSSGNFHEKAIELRHFSRGCAMSVMCQIIVNIQFFGNHDELLQNSPRGVGGQ